MCVWVVEREWWGGRKGEHSRGRAWQIKPLCALHWPSQAVSDQKKKMMSLSFFLSHILEKPVYCRSTKDLLLMSAYSTITASLLSGYSSSKSRSGSFPFFHPPTWCWIAGSPTNWMVLCVCAWSSASLHSPSSGQMLRIWWMLMRDATSFIIWYQSLCNWNSPGGWL